MAETMQSPEDRETLAAAHALGVLEGDARATALRLMLADRDFADRVAVWTEWFAPLHAGFAEVEPPESLWDAIAARIEARDRADTPSDVEGALLRRIRRWQAIALAAGAVAAILALAIGLRMTAMVGPAAIRVPVAVPVRLADNAEPSPAPSPASRRSSTPSPSSAPSAPASQSGGSSDHAAPPLVPTPPAPPVPDAAGPVGVAQLTGDGANGPRLAARIVMARDTIEIRARDIPSGARVPELWVIPKGGKPHSLGLIHPSGSTDVALTPAQHALIREGATLAVSMEHPETMPHRAPSGKPIASGKIAVI